MRILDAATISMALVILDVFCTLLILVRISLIPAITLSCKGIIGSLTRLSTPANHDAGVSGACQQ
ncbi:protein of unknown function [Alcaligenes faecalis subsp. faecalis]|nr:protein of unknown function [Alcaligenes faecalis subsp. faecalis]